MKKVVIGTLMITIISIVGLLTFSFLGEGSHLMAGQEDEWRGKPILEDQHIWAEVIVEKGEVYMSFEDVVEYLYPHMTKDVEDKKVLIEVKSEEFIFENENINSFVAGKELVLNFNPKEIEGKFYLPIMALEDILQVDVAYNEATAIVTIDQKESPAKEVVLDKNTSLVIEPKAFSRRITTLDVGEIVRVYGTEADYYFVRTQKGQLGYVKKDNINESDLMAIDIQPSLLQTKEEWKPEGNIGLVWDAIYSYSKDRSREEKIPSVDVISPTWFDLTSTDGDIKNKGDFQYAKDMRAKGYKIWGLVTNGFDPDLTSEFLANKDAQEHFIRQILIYSGLYELDGINIDFENIHYQDQGALTKFVANLTEKLHEMNLVVSIDVTIPSKSPNWSMVYDREKLGKIVDYVAVMTYDEHWGTSPKSGSVASIGWMEKGIQDTLELVPREKVLLGVPFYTRLWREEVQANGRIKVTSKAYGMEDMKEILKENEAEIVWDEEAGQYYAEYEEEGKTYKVWIEDARSLALKSMLVEKYGLAGYAAWRKDFETNDVWDTLEDLIKKGIEYEELLKSKGF